MRAGVGQNDVSWPALSGALAFHLYFSKQSGVRVQTATRVVVPGTSFVHAPLPAGATHFYAVAAVNEAGEGPLSAEVAGTPLAAPPRGDPRADPLFADQWHLRNTGQQGGVVGEDAGLDAAWDGAVFGAGVRIAVVDDGLELGHTDLAGNIAPRSSFNYLDGSDDPTGGDHGTSVAGVAAAVGGNGIGVSGAAPLAELVGFNFLASSNDANLLDAMLRDVASIAVSNNSWGIVGTGNPVEAPAAWFAAIDRGLAVGRGGQGTVYVFAGGNDARDARGGRFCDSNYSSFSNYHGVIAVGAIGDDGVQAFYSEPGANLWVCAPSLGNRPHGITTTDRSGFLGFNRGGSPFDLAEVDFTNTFSGTSSAAPLVSGIVALVLQAQPALGARDVKWILARSARQNDPLDPDWSVNGAGFPLNHKYGFGCVDAGAAVDLARTWVNVPPQKSHRSGPSRPGRPIPDASPVGVTDAIQVVGSGIEHIEYVEIRLRSADHTFSADLGVRLISPAGTVSILAEQHSVSTNFVIPYDDYVFGSARHLDEAADGTWTLQVTDLAAQDTGTLQEWELRFLGF